MSPIRIPPTAARQTLDAAVSLASAGAISDEWVEITRDVGAAASRTYVAALGTALLARATDAQIDPMSIKATPGAGRAYSARNLCHGVLVPASREYGFDLGATGREPLNNQPFFRYERIDEMERVRDEAGLRVLLGALRKVGRLKREDAEEALASFIRVRTDVADEKRRTSLRDVELGVRDAIDAATEFLFEGADGGKRGQALVAGVLDLVFEEVRMGRVNDPSRRFVGDVQALVGVQVVLAVEVRQKPVAEDDALAFARLAAQAGVGNAVVAAFAHDQPDLDVVDLRDRAEEQEAVLLTVIQSADELISAALLWSGERPDIALGQLPQLVADRLHEIEASERSLRWWSELISGSF